MLITEPWYKKTMLSLFDLLLNPRPRDYTEAATRRYDFTMKDRSCAVRFVFNTETDSYALSYLNGKTLSFCPRPLSIASVIDFCGTLKGYVFLLGVNHVNDNK